jgi:chemotaxis protein histidine kinase CheA
MTLFDAALSLLRDRKTSLTAEQLAALAVEKKLAAKATAAQIKALDKQLAAAADDEDGELDRSGGGYLTRRAKAKAKAAAKSKAAPAAKSKAAPAATAAKSKPAPAKAKAAAPAKSGKAKGKAGDEVAEARPATTQEIAAIEDAQLVLDVEAPVIERPDPAADAAPPATPLTEEEQALQELYGDDMSAPAAAHAEFSDRQTADEDRPMMPEISAREERNKRWEERRDRRRSRRDRRPGRDERPRDGGGGGGGGGGAANAGGGTPGGGPRPERGADRGPDRGDRGDRPSHGGGDRGPREPRPEPARHLPPISTIPTSAAPVVAPADGDAIARVGTPLGDIVAAMFAQLRNGQPLPVRQLAQMMRKRGLTEVDPEQLWPQLKAELLGDERQYRALGLRPRITYRGRDLFAPGPVMASATAEAEAGVATALSHLADATHRALHARLVRASAAGFERIIHAYLVAEGYRDIDWLKRVDGISYASALAPGLERVVLISARSGDAPIDRRGVGELRVGVEAKQLVAGVLFSARELAEDGERELERAGRSIWVVCGERLVAALVEAGVGVVSAAAPLRYVDDQLLDELIAG